MLFCQIYQIYPQIYLCPFWQIYQIYLYASPRFTRFTSVQCVYLSSPPSLLLSFPPALLPCPPTPCTHCTHYEIDNASALSPLRRRCELEISNWHSSELLEQHFVLENTQGRMRFCENAHEKYQAHSAFVVGTREPSSTGN